MMRIRMTALALALALVLTLPGMGLAENDYARRIEDYAAAHAETTAGASVAIFDADGTLYEGYFGHADISAGLPMTADTVVEWGSVTKLLVWISAMQQAEQGRLDLTADVRGYLPEGFLRNLRYDEPLTMLHLMNHQPGFEESYVGLWSPRAEEIVSLEDILRRHQPRQVYRPGTVTAYSNWGVALAGYIVERVSGQDFADYVQAHIFAPLGMTRSALRPDLSDNAFVRAMRPSLQCYTTDCTPIAGAFQHIIMYPAGMCTSTLQDFARFGSALLRRDEALLRPETWTELFTPTSTFGGESNAPLNAHGFWFHEFGVTMMGHGGNTKGCSSQLLFSPEAGVGMAVMTNQSNEFVYNSDLYAHLFGTYAGTPIDFRGWTVSARSVQTGPMRIAKLTSLIPLTDGIVEAYFAGSRAELNDAGGVRRVTMIYSDLLVKPFWQLLPEFLLVGLWVLCHVMWLGGLILLCIPRIRRGLPRALRRWSTAVCAVSFVPLAGIIPIAASLLSLNFLPAWGYQLVSGFCLGAAAAAVVLFLVGITAVRPETRRQRICRRLLLLSLIVTFVNVSFWQLGAFWLV